MKRWLKIAGVLLPIALAVFGWFAWSGHTLRASVERIRLQLRQQGLRTELSDFTFALSTESTNRAQTIIAAGEAVRALRAIHEL